MPGRLGRELGLTANQVALAWVLNQPFPTRAIVGVRTIPELEEAAAAADPPADHASRSAG